MPVSPPAAGQVFSELRRSQRHNATSLVRSHSGRLSGLLSGCPPTDTRPQARAKLGNCAHKRYARALQEIFSECDCRSESDGAEVLTCGQSQRSAALRKNFL